MYEFYRPTLYLPCKLFNRRFFVHLVWLYQERYKAFLPWPLLWDTQYDILLKSMFFRLLSLLSILVISLACSFNIFDDNDVCYWKEFWDFMKYFLKVKSFMQFWCSFELTRTIFEENFILQSQTPLEHTKTENIRI